jgi:small-conductance mechanosensitive channel
MDPQPAPPEPPAEIVERLVTPLQAFLIRPEILFGRVAMIAVTVLLAIVVYALIRRVLRRLQREFEENSQSGPEAARRRAQRSLTVVSLLGSIARWTILLAALLWVLAIAGVNLVPVLAGAGVVGLAVGLGAQSLIRDFVSGLFITLEGQFAVGDYVNIGGKFGAVEQLGLRVTVLRDLQGQLHYVPNGTIAAVTVYEEPAVVWGIELQTPADDADRARQELMTVLEDLRQEFPRQLLGWRDPQVLQLQTGLVGLQTVVDIFPEQEWVVQQELAGRWLRRVQEAGIALPEGAAPRVYAAIGVESGLKGPSAAARPSA